MPCLAHLPLLCPSPTHYSPLLTTFRHILNWFKNLSRKIVRFLKYFLEKCSCADSRPACRFRRQRLRSLACARTTSSGSLSRRFDRQIVPLPRQTLSRRRFAFSSGAFVSDRRCRPSEEFLRFASDHDKSTFALRASRAILNLLHKLQGVLPMEWTTPQHEEIDLNCEISSYANAEI